MKLSALLIPFIDLVLPSPAGRRCLCAPDDCTADAMSVIFGRKSVRRYNGRPLDGKTLELLVRAGMSAPSARDARPWRFIAVSDGDVLRALAEALPYGKMLPGAGGAIAVCGLPAGSALPGSDYWVQDCSAATENILLAAEALGLGAVWLGVHPRPERVGNVRRILGIPEDAVPLSVISLGYPAGGEKAKDKFEKEKLRWNRW